MNYVKITKLIKVGDSLGIIIPKNILDALKWERGDQIVFGVYDETNIIIKRVTDTDLKIWKTS